MLGTRSGDSPFDTGQACIYLAVAPYQDRPMRDTRNDTDSMYDDVGLMATQRSTDGLLGAINLGLDL